MARMCIIYIHPALRFHLRSSKASSKRFEGGFEVARMCIIYIHPALRFHLRSSKASSKGRPNVYYSHTPGVEVPFEVLKSFLKTVRGWP